MMFLLHPWDTDICTLPELLPTVTRAPNVPRDKPLNKNHIQSLREQESTPPVLRERAHALAI